MPARLRRAKFPAHDDSADIFDYVIVGGGTAAGIVAYRLGEAGYSVCVLEAGPPDKSLYLKIPSGFIKTLGDPKLTWQFRSEPDPATGSRPVPTIQGKTLGGSSSINGMAYNRGQAGDYDSWAQMGASGWSYKDILPYFIKTERRIAPEASFDPAYRGKDGLYTVTNPPWPNALEKAFIEAATARGYPFNPDYNAASQAGVAYGQASIANGRRVSSATAFLHPAAARFKVAIRTHSQALRLELKDGRATGVVYRHGGQERTVRARAEVIVSAGAMGSPKLLQLSGIGPAEVLKANGVPVRHALDGVGLNFRDHYGSRIAARVREGVDSLNRHSRGVALAAQVLRWMIGRPSILALTPTRAICFGKSNPALATPDYALTFVPGSFSTTKAGALEDLPGLTISTWHLKPQSSGYIHISSPDPDAAPRFNPRYLHEVGDQLALVEALKEARRLIATPPLASLVVAETYPGTDRATDEDLLAEVRKSGGSGYHFAGSCKMGAATDAGAVVDPSLKVRGIAGLRVIDASIMPTLVSGNTAAAVMMIAEKGADMILADARS